MSLSSQCKMQTALSSKLGRSHGQQTLDHFHEDPDIKDSLEVLL